MQVSFEMRKVHADYPHHTTLAVIGRQRQPVSRRDEYPPARGQVREGHHRARWDREPVHAGVQVVKW